MQGLKWKKRRRLLFIMIIFFQSMLILNCAGNMKEKGPAELKFYRKDNISLIDEYRVKAALQVQKNWIKPKDSNCDGNERVSIMFCVDADGQIKNMSFTEKSICKNLNDSAHSAVVRTAPFSPFPAALNAEDIIMGLRFSMEGVR